MERRRRRRLEQEEPEDVEATRGSGPVSAPPAETVDARVDHDDQGSITEEDLIDMEIEER